jgi:hypothetical protein
MELKFAKYGKDYSFVGSTNDVVTEEVVNGAVKALSQHFGIAESSVPYLLQYGFSQSMQDSIAGAAKVVATDLAEQAKKAGKPMPTDAEITAATEEHVAGLLGKRWDSLVSGDIGTRVPTQRDPVLALAREEIWNILRRPENAEKAKAIRALDKEARNAKITKLAEDYKAKYNDKLVAEVARRKQNDTGEIDISI